MDHHLIIVHPHADYAKGDVVTSKSAVDALLRDHPAKVIKVTPPARKP